MLCANANISLQYQDTKSLNNKKADVKVSETGKCFNPVLCKSREIVNDEILYNVAQIISIGDLFYEFWEFSLMILNLEYWRW